MIYQIVKNRSYKSSGPKVIAVIADAKTKYIKIKKNKITNFKVD